VSERLIEGGGGSLNRGDRIVLALGGGASRGLAHIGVCHVLEEEGIEIAGVAGTSIGSVIGAMIATGSLADYEEKMVTMTRKRVFSMLDPVIPRTGLFAGSRIIDFLRVLLGDTKIEDCEIPFVAVASGLQSGEEVWLKNGDLVDAVRASSSIPGLFTPVLCQDRWVIDGGISSPVPFAAASALSSLPVIAVDVNYQKNEQPLCPPDEELAEVVDPQPGKVARLLSSEQVHPVLRQFAESTIATGSSATERFVNEVRRIRQRLSATSSSAPPRAPGMIESLTETTIALQRNLAACQRELDPPELMIAPRLQGVGLFEFYRAKELILEGERATREALELHRAQAEMA
jgi:NTE family protein